MNKFFKEFKAFISRGNIMDMAVGVIIGGAFGKIVTSLVNDLLMPLITWALGASSLSSLSVVLRTKTDALGNIVPSLTWNYGAFMQTVIDFLIIAFCIFLVLKLVMKSQEALGHLAEEVTKGKPNKEQKAKLKAQGINMKDKEAVKQAYIELVEKEKLEKPVIVRKETEQELLLDIRNLLKQTNIKQPEPATVNPDIKKPIKRSNAKKQTPSIK